MFNEKNKKLYLAFIVESQYSLVAYSGGPDGTRTRDLLRDRQAF